MTRKIPVQIHILYTSSELLFDRIIINGNEEIKYFDEDYQEFSLQNEHLDLEIQEIPSQQEKEEEWFYKQVEEDERKIKALASKDGLQKELIQLDWLSRFDTLLDMLKRDRPVLFQEGIMLNVSIFLEILDTSIIFEKILIGGWEDILKKFNFLKITRFHLIGKNLISKKNIQELEVSSRVRLSEIITKNVDILSFKVRGFTNILKISGAKMDMLLWRPNNNIYEIKKDKASLSIINSEIGKIKIGIYEDSMAIFSSIRLIQSSISEYFQISGIKILLKKDDVGGLKFENSTFSSSSVLSIHNSSIEYLNLFKTSLNKLDIRNTVVSLVYLQESNINGSYFSGITGNGFYTLLQRNNKPNFSEIKEYYRHFKYSHDEIGNKTEANKFFAKEMEFQMKILKESGNRRDYWISQFQKWISDFGQNWIKALVIYICFCLFIYVIHGIISDYNWNLSDYINKTILFWINNSIKVLTLHWNIPEFNIFAKFLNPVPELKEDKTLFGLLFSIIKILLVYQIGVALRRISQR